MCVEDREITIMSDLIADFETSAYQTVCEGGPVLSISSLS